MKILKRAKKSINHKSLVGVTFLSSLAISQSAWAVTKPEDANAFGYQLYETAVEQLLHGPIGFVGGVAIVIISALQITKNWMLAASGVLDGTAVLKADSIVGTLGALI